MFCSEVVPSQFVDGARICASVLRDFDNVLIAAHVNLDGDALGSLAAAGLMMKNLGRNFALYSSSGVPGYLRFLPLPGHVYGSLAELPFKPQSALYLDCSDCSRLGTELGKRCHDLASVNIDHHIGGGGLGSLANYIEPAAAATAQLMAYVAFDLKMRLQGDLATAIALGLMTDTGGFCHGNTTADVFELCALLSRNGCQMSELRENIQDSWDINRMRFWGYLFSRVLLMDNNRIAISSISLEDFTRFHCVVEDLEGLVDAFRRLRGVKVAALLRQEAETRCKFSLRSHGALDVRKIAAVFGGGGHKNAAGGTIDAPLPMAESQLLETIRVNIN